MFRLRGSLFGMMMGALLSGCAQHSVAGIDHWVLEGFGAYPRPARAPLKPLVDSLMAAIAPSFWFTSTQIERPTYLPCDSTRAHPKDSSVVYWQVDRIDPRTRLPYAIPTDDPIATPFTWGDPYPLPHLLVTFYLYYPTETGAGAHPRDLEFVRVWLSVGDCRGGRCDYLIDRVMTSAHNDVWYYNIVERRSMTPLIQPLTVLVEDGKHAMALDVNRDGRYSPGIDTNVRIADAWGIRDNMGAGFAGGSAYQAWMTRSRVVDGRLSVPAGLGRRKPGDSIYYLRSAREAVVDWNAGGKLGEPFCGKLDGKGPDLGLRLAALDFGAIEPTTWQALRMQLGTLVDGQVDREPHSLIHPRLGLSLLVRSGAVLNVDVAWLGIDIPIVSGWIVPYGTFSSRSDGFRYGARYMPSSTKPLDWYVGAGVAPFQEDALGGINSLFQAEAGLRVRVKGVGLRLGVEAVGVEASDLAFYSGIGLTAW